MSEIALLREAVRALDGPVFAVLDGAQFADLPDALLRAGLRHRSLYLDRGDNHPERLVTAPQMLGPLDDERLDRTLALLDGTNSAAAVFWLCPTGPDSLYRHLRGLNMVRIPRQPGSIGASGGEPLEPHEAVLFRHADANVMAQVAPALDVPQLARLVGPAQALFFVPDPDWQDPEARAPVRIVRRKPDWPNPAGGLLTLQVGTLEAIEAGRLSMSRLRRTRYLRDTCRAESAGADDEAVARHILVSEQTGRDLGLVSESAHARWAFIMCKSNGRILEVPEVLRRIRHEGTSPDAQVKRLMEDLVAELRTRSATGMKS